MKEHHLYKLTCIFSFDFLLKSTARGPIHLLSLDNEPRVFYFLHSLCESVVILFLGLGYTPGRWRVANCLENMTKHREITYLITCRYFGLRCIQKLFHLHWISIKQIMLLFY